MKKIYLFIVALFAFLTGWSQTSGGRVQGTVIDGSQKTIESATIALVRAADTATVKFTVADKTGKYAFEDVPAGRYRVSVTAVGHTRGLTEVFELTGEQREVNLKTLELVPAAKTMGAVTVTAKKPLVEQ